MWGGASYLPCPANSFPDAEVDQDPGDGQRDGQGHPELAWFFQAVGQLMHVAPASGSEQQRDYYPQRGRGAGWRISGMHAGFKAQLCSQSKRKTINIVLPKLHHGTGEIRGVPNGVVCVTLLCIPWVVARAPR